MSPRIALGDAYHAVLEALAQAADDQAWAPTRCAGWAVHDLVYHLLGDAQRALVALHTPDDGPADTDEVTYWRDWRPGTDAAERSLRATRILASVWTFRPLVALYDETARAVLGAADRCADGVVRTQGKRLTTAALLRTLAVEATVHQLDLGLGSPSAAGLAEVRHVLDGLLGEPHPELDDLRYALVGTGRERLTAAEVDHLGPFAARFPLFG